MYFSTSYALGVCYLIKLFFKGYSHVLFLLLHVHIKINNAKKQCTYQILCVYTHARDFLPKQLWLSNQKQGGDLEKHQVAAMSPVLRVINLLSYENINCAIHQQ